MVGISTDRVPAQKRFAERGNLSFPMLCDEKGSVVRAYGVRGILGFARRVSFLIDPGGIVRCVYTKVAPRGHAEQVLGDLLRLLGKDR